MSKRAVVLAGGMGMRLRPYTVVLPKPLMPIGDYPILEVVVRQLARCGFDRITMAVNHQWELIKAFFGDGAKWGVAIDYSLEDKPLGTMGPLRLIADLPSHFLVMNGDVLTDLDFAAFHDEHARKDQLFTISSFRREQLIDYGVLDVDAGQMLSGFREKPRSEFEVSMGVYIVSRRAVDRIPDATAYGFDTLMLDLLKAREQVTVRRHDGYWLDIGRPDDYERAIEEFENMKARLIGG
ncbi:MAG: nucleotidyltransferase family protein [Gemmatimonadetes bacterium]|nr:nucleotidyltransferase family protein [Gemmatimonadota bacterium]